MMESAQPAVTILTPMSNATTEVSPQFSWAYLFNVISPGARSRLQFLGICHLISGLVAIGCEAYVLKKSGDGHSYIGQAGVDFFGPYLFVFGIIIMLIWNCQVFALTSIFVLGFYLLINIAKNAIYFSVTLALIVEECSTSSSVTCIDTPVKRVLIVLLVCAIASFLLVWDNLIVIAKECRPVSSYAARVQPLPIAYVNQFQSATTA